MKLPLTFPDETLFLDVEGSPVTFSSNDGQCLTWSDRDAAEPSPYPLDDMARNGKVISEAEFRALVHHCHTCALPALLVRAALDLQAMQREIVEMRAQGLTEAEVTARLQTRRSRCRDDEAETIALRAVAAASRSSRPA